MAVKETTWLLADGSRGQYVPRFFVEMYGPKFVKARADRIKETGIVDFNPWHIPDDCEEILLAGPDHENYWEAWDQCLSNCYLVTNDGKRMMLGYEGSDLFAVEEDA